MLAVSDLVKHFPVRGRGVAGRAPWGRCRPSSACRSTSPRARRVGLVGESGCGKSTVGRAILRLQRPTSRLRRGSPAASSRRWRRGSCGVRREMQIVFQDPYASLNPRMTVNDDPRRAVRIHGRARPPRRPAPGRRAARDRRARPRARATATRTSSPAASASASGSPARSRSSRGWSCSTSRCRRSTCRCRPACSTCSSELQERLGLTYLFIAHDLSVVRHICRPGRRDVPGRDRRDRGPRRRCSSARTTPTPRR